MNVWPTVSLNGKRACRKGIETHQSILLADYELEIKSDIDEGNNSET